MANTLIQLRSSGVTGNIPSTLQPGELAINYVDGKLFYGNQASGVVEFSTTTPAGLNGEIQFNSYGDLGATQNIRYESSNGTLYVNNLVANTLVNSVLTAAYDKAQGAYDLANTLSGGTSADGWARETANNAYLKANNAYDFANTLALSGGSTVVISDENISNNVYYINFTDKTSGITPSLNVSSNNLTFKPDTGTLSVKELTVSSNLSIVSKTLEITGTSQTVIDSFSVDLYRTAFYQFQVENDADFHSFNYNVGQNGITASGNTFGEIYSTSSLGTMSANISSGLVNVLFTPSVSATTVSFSRSALIKTSAGLGNDLGFLDSITTSFDYGFVGSTTTTLDLGLLA